MQILNFILNLIGLILSVGGEITVIRILNKWKGEFRDGIILFLWGFFIIAVAFIWELTGAEIFTLISSQSIFIVGTVPLTAGAFRIFTFEEI